MTEMITRHEGKRPVMFGCDAHKITRICIVGGPTSVCVCVELQLAYRRASDQVLYNPVISLLIFIAFRVCVSISFFDEIYFAHRFLTAYY